MPDFRAFDTAELDCCVISHAHLDHIGALPVLRLLADYRGPVVMTEATARLAYVTLRDYRRLSFPDFPFDAAPAVEVVPTVPECRLGVLAQPSHLRVPACYTDACLQAVLFPQGSADESDVLVTVPQATLPATVTFYSNGPHSVAGRSTAPAADQSPQPRGVRPTLAVELFPAGHLLGAACTRLQFLAASRAAHPRSGAAAAAAAGPQTNGAIVAATPQSPPSVVYTGDVGPVANGVVPGPRLPPRGPLRPTVLISEATFGGQRRAEASSCEVRLLSAIESTLRRHAQAKVLLPAPSLGRAQYLQRLVRQRLDRCSWAGVPVTIASALAAEVAGVYAEQEAGDRPERSQGWTELCEQPGRAVLIAAPAMLHGGPSLGCLLKVASGPHNLVAFTGACSPGSVGAGVAAGAASVTIPASSMHALLGREEAVQLPIRCRVVTCPLPAHADGGEVLELARAIDPEAVVLVHGQPGAIADLAGRVRAATGAEVFAPRGAARLLVRAGQAASAQALAAAAEAAADGPIGQTGPSADVDMGEPVGSTACQVAAKAFAWAERGVLPGGPSRLELAALRALQA